MSPSLRSLWRWSWVVTLPATAFLVYWGAATWDRYASLHLRLGSRDASLLVVGRMEFLHALSQVRVSLSPARFRDPALPRVALAVAESELARLERHLPQSGFEYVRGALWDRGRFRRAQIRYRGDSIYHWGNHKKSIRVKTDRDRLFHGVRRFNLLAPRSAQMLENHLSYRLAARLSLLAPDSESVELLMNGRSMGVYTLVEQPRELTLRRKGRMPGDLYKGEWINRDRYAGVSRHVFHHPGLWEKDAVNNHFPEDFRRPLEALLERVGSPHAPASHRGLGELVDLDAFARFAALQVLTQSTHVDNLHNWRLYYDPWRARFEPLVWDFMGWSQIFVPAGGGPVNPDIISSDLHVLLHRNAEFVRARHAVIRDFFESGGDREFLAEVDAEIDRVSRAVAADPNLYQYVGKHIDGPDHVRGSMRRMRIAIERIFADVRRAYLEAPGRVALERLSDGAVALSVAGRRPVERLLLRFRHPPIDPGVAAPAARVRAYRDGAALDADVSGALSLRGAEMELRTPLLANLEPVVLHDRPPGLGDNHALLSPARYELRVAGVGPEDEIAEAWADRGGPQLEAIERDATLAPGDSRFASQPVADRPVPQALLWSGEIAIEGVRELRGDLVIEPGTTVRLGPGASLLVRGRLRALGLPGRPVRFLPARPGEPWGTLALLGPAAAGSQLAHCEFSGGSGLRTDLAEYSAMLSIHDVPGVEVSHCAFRDSHVVDDMVHVVYGDVRFRSSSFERAFGDALDLDMTRAFVEGCRFVGSGNDAIDLMTTEAVVAGSLLEGSGDKGISVGEASRLLAIHDRLRGNAIGLQVKEASVAVAHNVDFTANDLALGAYKKNWQYGSGGSLFVYKSRFRDNRELAAADTSSVARLFDSYVDRIPPAAGRVLLHETVDSVDETRPQRDALWRFPEDGLQPGRPGHPRGWEPFWSRTRTRRGVGENGRRH